MLNPANVYLCLVFLALSSCAGHARPLSSPVEPPSSGAEDAGRKELTAAEVHDRLRACETERKRGDPVRARADVEELIASLEASSHPDAPRLLDARAELGRTLAILSEPSRAVEILEGVLAARTRQLPPGALAIETARIDLAHACRAAREYARARDLSGAAMTALEGAVAEDQRDLLSARLVHSIATSLLGDPEAALPLAEETLQRFLASYGEDDPDLQMARVYLALVLSRLGRVEEAHALNLAAEAALAELLPAGHPSLLRARINLATTTRDVGDYPRALELFLRAAEDGTQALSEAHPFVLSSRMDASYLLTQMGRTREALALEERLLAVQERLKGPEHPDAISVKGAMGLTLRSMGELTRARSLQEEVVRSHTGRLREDDPLAIRARGNLAITILELGDPWAARAEFERIGEIYAKTLPEDHPEFLLLRQNLSVALGECGDFEAARALEERTIETMAQTLPDDHPNLQVARISLAATLSQLGDDEGARDLLEKVLAILSPVMEEDNAYLVAVRQNLSTALKNLDERGRALELDEQNLAVLSRARDPDSIPLQHAKLALSGSKRGAGQHAESCALAESALEVLRRTLPPGHPTARRALFVLSLSRRAAGDLAGACETGRELCAALRLATEAILLRSSPREAEEATEPDREAISWVLELAGVTHAEPGGEEFAREAFELVEGRRALGLRAARLQHLLPEDPETDAMRSREREASRRIADLVQEGGSREELDEARQVLDRAQKELATRAGRAGEARVYLSEVSIEDLRRSLRPDERLVGFWRYTRLGEVHVAQVDPGSEERILAHVLAPDGSLARVDLGPATEIEELVQAHRASIGGEAGRGVSVPAGEGPLESDAARRLARRLFDPLRAALGDARKVTVALDDVLTLVPLEALPDSDQGISLIGERIGIRVVSALTERAWPAPDPPASRRLLALGGLEYDDAPDAAVGASIAGGTARSARPVVSASFGPLPATATEVRSIAALVRSVGRGEAVVLEGAAGSASAFADLAPTARWVHLATHGWFADEANDAIVDGAPLDPKSGFGRRRSAMEQVRGSMPMSLCGLALAGANRRDGARGLITAEEIATLDLGECEMAVLSACDTGVGVVRAGQGVASLQKALHMAGARTVVTSLWKVPDEATQELMVDFYRRIWVEGKPKDEALWEAKMRLRDSRDTRGELRYTTRDWAAWVLTGTPE